MSQHHVHLLRDGQKTGSDKIMVTGEHVHELPNGVFTNPSINTPSHVHQLPDGSMTPGGPIPDEDDNDDDTRKGIPTTPG